MSRVAVWRSIKAPLACKKPFSSTMRGGGGVGFARLARHSRKPFLHSRGTRARPCWLKSQSFPVLAGCIGVCCAV